MMSETSNQHMGSVPSSSISTTRTSSKYQIKIIFVTLYTDFTAACPLMKNEVNSCIMLWFDNWIVPRL